ncbi:MAG TPA: hypothetical protein VFU22_17725 [Roseiflexaceae bacterium]|nr:hypothetical protein [Roseiflexaceae bacterium]
MSKQVEIWDLWFPDAAAQGLPFARGRLEATDVLLVHAAPAILRVDVLDDRGALLSRGERLERTAETPITRLHRRNGRVERADIWPGPPEIGLPVMLAGGEVGILTAWWNDPDLSAWRWSIELFNHK